MREPPFWWREGGLAATLLGPLAAIYGAIAARRMRQQGERSSVPVVCIGNPTLGGAGKTPLAIALARLLATSGHRPVLLTRGYGGRLAGPVEVDIARHTAGEIGDEALLLAAAARTIVARDRVRGAAAAVAAGAEVIVMDDGFQNPSLIKDCSILVIDARRGVGNGRTFPAGPLRAPLADQLARAQAVMIVGEGGCAIAANGRPVFHGRLDPDPAAAAALQGVRTLAYAGIGDPEKFFATCTKAGIILAATRAFADHHRWSAGEADELVTRAEREGLVLLTTEKDLARMRGEPRLANLAARSRPLPVSLVIDDAAGFADWLRAELAQAGVRRASPPPLQPLARSG